MIRKIVKELKLYWILIMYSILRYSSVQYLENISAVMRSRISVENFVSSGYPLTQVRRLV